MSICGRIFDLSSGKSWYGPEGPYNCFAASDATFMLGAMDLKEENRNKVDFGAWAREDLSAEEIAALSDEQYCSHADFDEETLSGWVLKFVSKYPVIGRLEGFENVGARFWTNIVGSTGAIVGDAHAKESPSREISLGEVDRSTQVSVGGWVFDVSIASWLYEPIYGDFPNAVGREISAALVTDEFNDETLDAPVQEVLETEEQKGRLVELVKLFKSTYPCVGQLKNAAQFQF
jgi:membrane-associated progesterone receptor component